MSLPLRLICSLIFLSACLFAKMDILTFSGITVFLVIVKIHVGVPARILLKQNIMVVSFVIFYLFFGSISMLLDGGEFARLLRFSVRIFLIFNIINLSLRWIGTDGMLKLAGLIPSERMKLYLILVGKGVYLFERNSEMIVMQIRSRLTQAKRKQATIARYYVHNMIHRELYSIQHLQATLYNRLPDSISPVYLNSSGTTPADCLVLALTILFITGLFFHG